KSRYALRQPCPALRSTSSPLKYAILDETDSGLDIGALKTVAHGVNSLRSPDLGVLLITHYQRLLNYIIPDYVHVISSVANCSERAERVSSRARRERLRLGPSVGVLTSH